MHLGSLFVLICLLFVFLTDARRWLLLIMLTNKDEELCQQIETKTEYEDMKQTLNFYKLLTHSDITPANLFGWSVTKWA